MPGATQALRVARDPIGVATERLQSVDRDENLLSNGDLKKRRRRGSLPSGGLGKRRPPTASSAISLLW